MQRCTMTEEIQKYFQMLKKSSPQFSMFLKPIVYLVWYKSVSFHTDKKNKQTKVL